MGEQHGCAGKLEVGLAGEFRDPASVDELIRVLEKLGDPHREELIARLALQPARPALHEPGQRVERQRRARHDVLINVQPAGKQRAQALSGHVVVVMRIAVQRLQERHAADQLSARLEHTRNLGGAGKGVAHVFEHRERQHRIERIVPERKLFADAKHIGRLVVQISKFTTFGW